MSTKLKLNWSEWSVWFFNGCVIRQPWVSGSIVPWKVQGSPWFPMLKHWCNQSSGYHLHFLLSEYYWVFRLVCWLRFPTYRSIKRGGLGKRRVVQRDSTHIYKKNNSSENTIFTTEAIWHQDLAQTIILSEKTFHNLNNLNTYYSCRCLPFFAHFKLY